MLGLVAAGALAPPALRECGVERIPLLCVAGETLLARTCRCLITGGGCGQVAVLAPESVPLPQLAQVRRATYTGAIVDDVLACVKQASGMEYLLLASGDMPLLTPEAVAAVADAGQQTGADVLYPVVEQATVVRRFGASRRTYVRLGALTVTGGNAFWLRRGWLLEHGPLLKRLFAKRKDPVGLARIMGLGFFIRLLLGRLDLPYLEGHLSRILHGSLRAAVLPCAELAVDLDKPADLETFKPYLDPWR